jgi:hypothetical protein
MSFDDSPRRQADGIADAIRIVSAGHAGHPLDEVLPALRTELLARDIYLRPNNRDVRTIAERIAAGGVTIGT